MTAEQASAWAKKFVDYPGETSDAEAMSLASAVIRLAGENANLTTALRSMCATHGMHGPCRQNNCRDCVAAYNAARELLEKVGEK